MHQKFALRVCYRDWSSHYIELLDYAERAWGEHCCVVTVGTARASISSLSRKNKVIGLKLMKMAIARTQ